uniref:Uncharacterized protein n=1 Tax=Inoviridae sp. ctTUL13 TaxID=2825782 RepID=A0A8S5UQA4_9VIRU|nr:MAG TPA: hypothetical protein [Inoviridae sp. ctTUL13]
MDEYFKSMNQFMEESAKGMQEINQIMAKGATQMYYMGTAEAIISIIITIAMIYYIFKSYDSAKEAERKIRNLEQRFYELEDHIEKMTGEKIKHRPFFD